MRLKTLSPIQFFKFKLLVCLSTFLEPDCILQCRIRVSGNDKSVISFCFCDISQSLYASLRTVCVVPFIVSATIKVTFIRKVEVLDICPLKASLRGYSIVYDLSENIEVLRWSIDCIFEGISILIGWTITDAQSLSQDESWKLLGDCFEHLFNCKSKRLSDAYFQLNALFEEKSDTFIKINLMIIKITYNFFT